MPDSLTDEQLFALALAAGCEMTSSVRSEDGKLMMTLTTAHPVGYCFAPDGKPVVVELTPSVV